jgi:hypothetical protein
MRKRASVRTIQLFIIALISFVFIFSCSMLEVPTDSDVMLSEVEAPTYIQVTPHSSSQRASSRTIDNNSWNDIMITWHGNPQSIYTIQRKIEGEAWITLFNGYVSHNEHGLYYLDNDTDYWWQTQGWNGLVYYRVGASNGSGQILYGEVVCFVLVPQAGTLRVSLSQAHRAYKCDVYKMFGSNQGQMIMGDSMDLWETVDNILLPAGSWVAFSIDVLTTFSCMEYTAGEHYKLDSNSWQCKTEQIPTSQFSDDALLGWYFNYEDILLERPFCDFDYNDIVLMVELINDGSGVIETGTITGTVKDALINASIENVLVTVYDADNTVIAANITNLNGEYSFVVPVGIGYRCEYTKENYISTTYSNIQVQTDQTEYLEVVYIQPEQDLLGDASGQITDALNGSPVAGIQLEIREGLNVSSGTIITELYTDSLGYYYIVSLPEGNYTATINKAGYITSTFTIRITGGQSNRAQNATITPELGEGELRIVLTWGQYPSDLDSHLTGPIEFSNDRFHVCYFMKGDRYNSPYALLDYDDITSWGPETITIYQLKPGVYRYSIHDYTNRGRTYSTALAASGAKVEVFQDNRKLATFNVPNEEGTQWTVFELEGNQINPINLFRYESSPSNVRSIALDNADIISNLPEK